MDFLKKQIVIGDSVTSYYGFSNPASWLCVGRVQGETVDSDSIDRLLLVDFPDKQGNYLSVLSSTSKGQDETFMVYVAPPLLKGFYVQIHGDATGAVWVVDAISHPSPKRCPLVTLHIFGKELKKKTVPLDSLSLNFELDEALPLTVMKGPGGELLHVLQRLVIHDFNSQLASFLVVKNKHGVVFVGVPEGELVPYISTSHLSHEDEPMAPTPATGTLKLNDVSASSVAGMTPNSKWVGMTSSEVSFPAGLDVRANYSPQTQEVELRVRVESKSGTSPMYSMPAAFSTIPEGQIIPPMLRLSHSEAKKLMDELWDCGVRPSAGFDSPGVKAELVAVKQHLEDMRQIAFSMMDLKK